MDLAHMEPPLLHNAPESACHLRFRAQSDKLAASWNLPCCPCNAHGGLHNDPLQMVMTEEWDGMNAVVHIVTPGCRTHQEKQPLIEDEQ